MTQSPIETLQKARALISDPKRWTQVGYDGTTKMYGHDVVPISSPCFCAVGALSAVSGRSIHAIEAGREYFVLCDVAGMDIIDSNDERSHAEVLDVFDFAIAIEKAKAKASSEPHP